MAKAEGTAAKQGPLGFTFADFRLIGICVLAAAATFVLRLVDAGDVLPFLVSAVALAVLAMLVGRSVEALGDKLGPGATGVVQSALGNLPELFVVLFSLKAGLVGVVQSALVGSILANVLLVLGLAFTIGGFKNGEQRFSTGVAQTISLQLVLAVFALLVPSLTSFLHTPAAGHEVGLSIVVSIVLLVLFAASLPAAIKRDKKATPDMAKEEHAPTWPLWVSIGMLAIAGVGAAFVSDWFVDALEPAIEATGISQAFAGLVVVAIAGNAVENVVGIQLAAKNKADYALSVILQSPLQIALVIAPVVVLAAPLVSATAFTLVLPPLLIAVLVIAVLTTVLVVLDGKSNWYEGITLIALYAIIATAFWWG